MKVFFATPTHRGIQHPPFLDALEETVELCKAHGIETTFTLITGCCYVQVGRNDLVHRFLESDADVLFFLDDDLSWPAQAVIDLLQTPDDIITGAYPLKDGSDTYPVLLYTDEHDVPVQRTDGCVRVAGAPTGFMKITRQALEKLIAAYPGQQFVEYKDGVEARTMYDLFPQGVRDRRWVGEDYAFCRLWTDLGGEIWVKPDIDFKHYSAVATYEGNFHQHLLRHTS